MSDLQKRIQTELGVRPTIDPHAEIARRVNFLRSYLIATGAKGLVLGISGGQDSTLAGRLAQLAAQAARSETGGSYTFIAVRLPYGTQHDEEDAVRALQFIQPDKTLHFDIRAAVDASAATFASATGEPLTDFNKGNAKARERMKVQFDLAAQFRMLVVGTDHAAESVTGFFTKFGDGACDIAPLVGLTKRQGRELLQALGAEPALYDKVPTADLLDERPGQPDETELGLTYDQIDDYLEGKPIDSAAQESLERRFIATRHKRALPVTPFDTWWKA